MSSGARRIAVLGAPGTGADELLAQLRSVLAAHTHMALSGELTPSSAPDLVLLMGLDQPATGTTAHQMQQHDARIREQLYALQLPYRMVYGSGPTRLANALLALGLPAPDTATQETRQQAQFDLNRGRTPWSCGQCSDPACEHKLFTSLLLRR